MTYGLVRRMTTQQARIQAHPRIRPRTLPVTHPAIHPLFHLVTLTTLLIPPHTHLRLIRRRRNAATDVILIIIFHDFNFRTGIHDSSV
jgi:hypothetical protein